MSGRPRSSRPRFTIARDREGGSNRAPGPFEMGPMNRVIDRYAVVFVALAATMWASDAYFRNQLVQHLSATQIVVAEDALITLFLLPVLIRSRHELRLLGARGWTAVAIIAAGAQALATILFTA